MQRGVFALISFTCVVIKQKLFDGNLKTAIGGDSKAQHDELTVVKLNEGFSGEGNALFFFKGAPHSEGWSGWS